MGPELKLNAFWRENVAVDALHSHMRVVRVHLLWSNSPFRDFFISKKSLDNFLFCYVFSPIHLRMINDQLMQLEKGFILPEGLPNRPLIK